MIPWEVGLQLFPSGYFLLYQQRQKKLNGLIHWNDDSSNAFNEWFIEVHSHTLQIDWLLHRLVKCLSDWPNSSLVEVWSGWNRNITHLYYFPSTRKLTINHVHYLQGTPVSMNTWKIVEMSTPVSINMHLFSIKGQIGQNFWPIFCDQCESGLSTNRHFDGWMCPLPKEVALTSILSSVGLPSFESGRLLQPLPEVFGVPVGLLPSRALYLVTMAGFISWLPFWGGRAKHLNKSY